MKKKNMSERKGEMNFEFGQVMTMLEQMHDGIGVIAETQTETNQKLDGIDGRLIRVEHDVVEIKHRLMRVEEDVIDIKHKLSEKVDRDEFNKMEKRIVKLEKLVFAKLA